MWARNECCLSGRIAKEPAIYTHLKSRKKYLSFPIINRVNFSPVARRKQIINIRGFGYYVEYHKWLKVGDNVDVAGFIIVKSEPLSEVTLGKMTSRKYRHGINAYLHLTHLYDYSEFNRIHAGLCENFKKPKHFFQLMSMEMEKRHMNTEDYDCMEKFLPDFLKKEWQQSIEKNGKKSKSFKR